jgi:hypothetical protein
MAMPGANDVQFVLFETADAAEALAALRVTIYEGGEFILRLSVLSCVRDSLCRKEQGGTGEECLCGPRLGHSEGRAPRPARGVSLSGRLVEDWHPNHSAGVRS